MASVVRPSFGVILSSTARLIQGKLNQRVCPISRNFSSLTRPSSPVCACQQWVDSRSASYQQRPGGSHLPMRQSSTGMLTASPGMIARMWDSLGLPTKMRYKKKILQRAALRLYLCTTELVDYDLFFTELELPDTFNSWFRITELHVWMVMVRLATEGKEGAYLRNIMMTKMWQDVDKRVRKLGETGGPSSRREVTRILGEQLRGAVYAYDEGLLGDDRELAAAIWRTFFELECDNPNKVDSLVRYIRKQISHIEQQESGVVVPSGLITYLPFDSDDEDIKRTRQILVEITKRL